MNKIISSFFTLVIGSSRGIGYGLAKQFLQRTNAKVIASCRDPPNATLLHELSQKYGDQRIIIPKLDVRDEYAFEELHDALPSFGVNTIDILIGNAGVSNPDHPDDTFMQCRPDEMLDVFRTNVVGNMKLLQTFKDMLCGSTLKIALIMSSSFGSLDHAAMVGGATSFRVSKSALNMLCVLYATDPVVREVGVRTLIMHPGWVKTDLGLAKGQPAKLELDHSTAKILDCLERVAASRLVQYAKIPDKQHVLQQIQFGHSLDEILQREYLNPMMGHLERDNFVYTSYDGGILEW